MTHASICSVCVLDDSLPNLTFDDSGQCGACRDAVRRMPHEWWPGSDGETRMKALVAMLKHEGRDRPYDAMVGLSGGIDSAYLAHLMATRYDLRLLAVHVDGGWNSAPAVRNIESIVRALDLDLHTEVIEWKEMRDLQLAFLRAGVVNQDIPQDHAFFATLYRTAARFGMRHFLSGVNFASESIQTPGLGFPAMDGTHLKGIHARFGQAPLKTFPIMPLPEFLWVTRISKQLTKHKPLDFLPYDKEAAKAELTRTYGWRDYGGKHSESRFTKFYQEVYLPRKYGYDKRRLHLSALIVAGQLTREQALEELATPIVDPAEARRDIRFVAKKLGITAGEFDALIDAPPVPHTDYPNEQKLHLGLMRLRSAVRKLAA